MAALLFVFPPGCYLGLVATVLPLVVLSLLLFEISPSGIQIGPATPWNQIDSTFEMT
jgi:hypothetical protein